MSDPRFLGPAEAGIECAGDPPTRRRLLKAGFGCVVALDLTLARGAAAAVAAVRVWPAKEYTRVTLELAQPLEHSHFTIENPHRVVVDLQGIAVDASLRELVAKVIPSDPYIQQIRVGQFDPQTMRLVFDLKQRVKPQVFTLAPVAHYRHRLVIDLYPTVPPDPLDLLIAQTEATAVTRGRATEPAQAPGASAEPSGRGGGQVLPRRAPVSRMVTIAIDPGHGGEDPGAIGPRGTLEKDVVLAVAARVQKKLAREPETRVYLTRDGDYFVPLATRVSKARAVKADLFVSIHADAFVMPRAQGSSVYVLSDSGASSVEARWLASKENNADLVGGVNLRTRNRETAQLLMELMTTSQIRDSRKFAASVLSELGDIGRLHKPGVEQAGFAVLKAPDVPSILVETAFISNPEEEMKLRSARYQDALADAIVRGIRAYFRDNPPGPRGRTL
ncbi:MAG: N-acetylmuramoyl-L-alanine amidase [Lautropia sp.]|nr:N-acetylmuramoyl-L-alanine amidase [Lautropia sp.]